MKWTTPAGWPIVQDYRVQKTHKVLSLLGGAVRELSVKKDGSKLNKKKSISAVCANYIHGFDASIMHSTVAPWERAISATHDDAGTLCTLINSLLPQLRKNTADICIRQDPLMATKREVEKYLKEELPDPPRLGYIDPLEVEASELSYS